MRIVAQYWLGRHHRGNTAPLALIVAFSSREDCAPERAGASELHHSVGDGRAGVEQHPGDVVVPPRNRHLKRIFCAREAPGARAQGSDDGDMTIGRSVPKRHSPAIVACVDPGAAFDQELDDIRSPGGRRGMKGRETPSVGSSRTRGPGFEDQVKKG